MQFDQPELYGSDVLASKYGKRLTFHSPVDIQKIMPTGDKEYIEKSAVNMVNVFKKIGGGLIAKDYPQWGAVAVEEEWATWARDTIISNSKI